MMTNVTATGSGGTENFGIVNYSMSSPMMTNIIVNASGGTDTYTYGVWNGNSSPTMMNVIVNASGGAAFNEGIVNYSSSPTMTDVTVNASGGDNNYGVSNIFENNTSSSIVMMNVRANASGGNTNFGVISTGTGTGTGTGTVRIDHSVITGSTNTIWSPYANVSTYVGSTKLDGGPVSGSGTTTCAGVYDENYVFYTNTCP